MPKYHKEFSVEGKSADEIYEIVAAGIERFLNKTPVGNHDLSFLPENHSIAIESTMLTATLYCSDDGINLEGEISFLALPFKAKLDDGIDRWLAKNFT